VLTAREGDTPEMIAVLETLREQTERHAGRLSESIVT
jgi:fructoselysine-6-P-deglycase FrlB-like protein